MSEVKLRGFTERVSVDEALKRFFDVASFGEVEAVEVGIDEGLGKILAEDIYAEYDVPPFDRSAMDGYAVRSRDTAGASTSNPLIFKIVGASEMGQQPHVTLLRFNAVRISTGAPIPDGADAVIMLEYARGIGGDRVEVYRSVTPYENVSRTGEDVKKDDKILAKGTVLHPQDIGILAAVRRKKIKVLRNLRIAVLSTGDELVEIGDDVKPGKIIDVNRHTLIASVREMRCEPIDLGIARDDLEEIESKINEGLEQADIVLVSGGISVGAKDLVSEAVNRIRKPGTIVHGVSMRPGMPTALAAVGRKPLVLFPGSPVAALVSFNVFVKPTVARMLGIPIAYTRGQIVKAKMTRKAASAAGLRTFLRVIVRKADGEYVADPVRTSGSNIISSLVKANGIVVIPEWKEGVEKGEEVEVELLKPLSR